MDAKISENLFASYLESNHMSFERDFKVCGQRNVDFRINKSEIIVLCDVKEVRDSRVNSVGKIDAYTHIREDLKDLRKKFGRNRPSFPVILVSMNFSCRAFTAHTVARAMFGDIGAVLLDKERGEIHHLPRGNASMTRTTNTSISGIFVFDCVTNNHTYFSNEYANIEVPQNYFQGVTEINLKRSSGEEELVELAKIMFWECDVEALTKKSTRTV